MKPAVHAGHRDLRQFANVRVAGVLTADAVMAPTMGREPHCLLVLQFEPAHGLPYYLRLDVGADVADQMAIEAELPALRRGALISVAGDSLQLCQDHGHARLRVLNPRDLVIFSTPIPSPGAANAA